MIGWRPACTGTAGRAGLPRWPGLPRWAGLLRWPGLPGRGTTARLLIIAGLLAGSWLWPPAPPARIPLDAASAAQLTSAATRSLPWDTAGSGPGDRTSYAAMVRRALLDLHALTTADGAAIAGQSPAWHYVWPRDAAFVAVALTRAGHPADATAVLTYLQRMPIGRQGFQARYLPDGSGRVPDRRGVEEDGAGWVLWAAAQLVEAVPAAAPRAGLLTELGPLIERCAGTVLRITDGGRSLPPPSKDYWEVPERETTLGVAAPLLAGLYAVESLHRIAGRPDLAAQDGAAAARLARVIRTRFGPEYGRHPGDRQRDAAVAFLLPPFLPTPPDQALRRAWSAVQTETRRPAGGLAPGVDWQDDGISWTPETALFALTAAALGDRATAEHWLGWLSAHRTPDGAVSEKVLADGSPAAVAPLAWTAAEIVITASILDPPQPS